MADDKPAPETVPLKDSSQQTGSTKDKSKKKHRKSKSRSKKNGKRNVGGSIGGTGNYNAAMGRNTRAFTLKSGDFTSRATVDGANVGDDIVTAAAKAAHSDLQRAHHATVASLASINGKFMVQQLTKASQDLKMQHELRKALEELHAKEQDFLMAVEISDKLSKDNKRLNDEIEELRLQVHELNLDNQILAEKMHAISNSYQQDMNKYQTDLIEHKEIMAQLELELDQKAKLVDELEDKVSSQDKNGVGGNKYNNKSSSNKSGNKTGGGKYGGGAAFTSAGGTAFQSISQLTSGNLSTSLEKELFVKLEQERRRAVEQMESFMEQMDEFEKIKKENTDLKTENEDLQEALKEQLQHQQHIQKAMQEEVIALAARNSNLEHQKDEYAKLLDQRDYEIDLLKQQIYLERKQSVVVARQMHGMSVTSETGNFEDLSNMQNMPKDLASGITEESDDDGNGTEGESMSDDTQEGDGQETQGNDGQQGDDDKKMDEVDLDEINAMIDDMIESDKARKMTLKDGASGRFGAESGGSTGGAPTGAGAGSSAIDDVFVPDVIKEYLHLTASAVKIKYPKITNITSEELIGQAKSLPFFQYHDYMVRIMEKESTNQEISKKQQLKEREQLRAHQKKKLQKRRSFLSLFGGWLGNDDESGKGDENDNTGLVPTTNIASDDEEDGGGGGGIGGNSNSNGGPGGNLNYKKKNMRQISNNSLQNDIDTNNGDEMHNHHARNVGSPKTRSRKNTNQLTADIDEDGYGSDSGYQSDGNGSKGKAKRHSASRFKNKKKRGVSAHASQRRLGGIK